MEHDTSSILFRNSGLNERLSSAVTLSFIFSYCVCVLSCWKPRRRVLVDHPCAQVRGHDDDGVPEIHLSAETVGHEAVIKHLQEHVEDVGMSLFDLIEEHDRIGPPPDLLGQLPAVIIPDIAGRGPDQAGRTEFFHVFRHVHADKGVFTVEKEHGQGPCKFGFPDAGRTQEYKGTDRLFPRLEADPGAPDGAGDGLDGRVLADDPLVQLFLHPSSREASFSSRRASGMPVMCDTIGCNILFTDDRNVLFLVVLPVLMDAVKGLAQPVFFFMNRFDPDIILDPGEEVLFLFELLQLLLDGLHLRRIGIAVQLCLGACLVDHVDGLVRQDTGP